MQITKRSSGISLLEVLAAIFVVSIGLLGVLAVIPFGAFQVSRAQQAEYASNMLANAAEIVVIREMAKPEEWLGGGADWSNTEFIWIEPRMPTTMPAPQHISRINASYDPTGEWTELMRGQDDLDYTIRDYERPDFSGQGGTIQGSGRYTWFFTFKPEAAVDEVPVDVLACFNRVPEDDRQVPIPPGAFSPSRRGGIFSLPTAEHSELLSQTRYVFVTWEETATPNLVDNGAWCRIVFVDRSSPPGLRIIVTGALPNLNEHDAGGAAIYTNIHVYIPSGVLYHKRVADVPIR